MDWLHKPDSAASFILQLILGKEKGGEVKVVIERGTLEVGEEGFAVNLRRVFQPAGTRNSPSSSAGR